MHRECVNARRPDLFLFEVGNFIWVRRQIKSNKAKCTVEKLRFQHTGPCEITKIVAGGSYELRHCDKHNTTDKKKTT